MSSRKLEQATYDSVAMRYLTANTHPDHDTIAHFRKRFVGIAGRAVRADTERCAGDGGVASWDGESGRDEGEGEREQAQGDELGVCAAPGGAVARGGAHVAGAGGGGRTRRQRLGWTFPRSLERREARLATIERAKVELERRAQERYEAERAEYEEKLARRRAKEQATGRKARGREPKAPQPGPREKDQVNFTDEESRIMASSQGFVQGYNAQAAVDVDTHLVVGRHVSDKANDKQEMAPALERLDAVQEVVGRPQAILADAGYMSDDNVRRCEAGGIEPYIASGRERHNAPLAERLEPAVPGGEPGEGVGGG